MNFPDLETCKSIEDEFQESEFVYVKSPAFVAGTQSIILPDGQSLHFRKRNSWKASEYDELIAPAPTCEELGKFIIFNAYLTHGRLNRPMSLSFLIYTCAMSKCETQARAEAVKLILEEK
jgi:hypothetical protein